MAHKQKHSPLWFHFEEIEPKKARCVYCLNILAISSSSIGTLRRHLKAKHPTVNVNRHDALPIIEMSEEPINLVNPIIPDRATSQLKQTLNQDKINQLDEQVVKMIAKGYHNLEIVEEKEIQKFVKMLNPKYTLPTRKILSETLLSKVYNKILEGIKRQIAKAVAICVTTEGWTSITNDRYIAITAHYIDQESDKFNSVMIGCIHFEEWHTSSNLSEFLKSKFLEWGIENAIVAFVSDNTVNMLNAVRLGGWCSFTCFAHTINSVVQASVSKISDTIDKVKRIVEYFHRNKIAAEELRDIQQLDDTELKLKRDRGFGWNFTYDMLVRVKNMKDSIIATLLLLGSDLLLSQEDWEIIKKVIPILKIFHEIIKEICGEKYVSASSYIVYCKLINKTVDKYTEETFTSIQEVINTLKFQMKMRFRDVETNVLLSEATILDPRFKKNGFSNVDNYEKAAAALKLKLGKIILPSTETDVSDVAPNDVQSDSIWEDFYGEESVLVPQNPIDEFDKYIQEPLLKRHENPLDWWRERKAVYPHLYSYMLKRLNITATSVPCERVFSKAGLELNERRTRLSTNKLSEFVFISCNC